MKEHTHKQTITLTLLTGFGLLLSAIFWSQWERLLSHPLGLSSSLSNHPTATILLVVSGIFTLAFTSLIALLSSNRLALLSHALLFTPLFLLTLPLWVLSLSFALLWLSTLFFTRQVKHEVQNHIQFSTPHTFNARLPLMITALSLVLGLQFSVAAQGHTQDFRLKIPETVFEQAIKLVQPTLDKQINQQVQNARHQTNQLLQQIPGIDQLSPEAQKALLRGNLPQPLEDQLRQQGVSNQQITQLKTQLQQLGQMSQPDTGTLRDQLTRQLMDKFKTELESQINQILEPYLPYLPAFLGFVVFLVIKTFGGVINLVAVSLTGILISLLLQAGIVKKKVEEVKAERLVIG